MEPRARRRASAHAGPVRRRASAAPPFEVGVHRPLHPDGRGTPPRVWLGEAIRPTKDVDLLGFGDTSAEALKRIFVALCEVHAPEDGLTFVAESVRVEAIREGQEYGGMRVTLMAMLGRVRIPLQVDIGAGDAVVPPPDTIDYPGLLDLPRARVCVYRPETSI